MILDARRSTPDAITQNLRAAILTGAIGGGSPLRQNDVAAQFGVSVVPVREAFQRLIAQGLAEHRPNRGVLVTALTAGDLTEIAELRILLEPYALRLSAPDLPIGNISAAEAILHQAAATSDLLERARLHWDPPHPLQQGPAPARARSTRPSLYQPQPLPVTRLEPGRDQPGVGG